MKDATKYRARLDTTRPGTAYNIWHGMRDRCENPACDSFPYYGAKGIKVCDRWRASYIAFRDDMGPRPSAAHSIDRIDGTKDYEPGNCRWATASEQARNRSSTLLVTYQGRSMSAVEASELSGVPYDRLKARIRTGITGPALFAAVIPRGKGSRKNLCVDEVQQIKATTTESAPALARQFGVSASCIRAIRQGRIWKNV